MEFHVIPETTIDPVGGMPYRSTRSARMPGDIEAVAYRKRLISSRTEELQLGDKRIPMEYSTWTILPANPPADRAAPGEIDKTIETPIVPYWCQKTGRLFWKGKEIGKFQLRGTSTMPEQILRAFQESNWPDEIENPLGSAGKRCFETHQVVNYLNNAIAEGTISFHVRRGGKAIFWQSIESASEVGAHSK